MDRNASETMERPDGTTAYTPMVEFRDFAAKTAFQKQALEAIDVMLSELAREAS
jgi:hypothetical protein